MKTQKAVRPVLLAVSLLALLGVVIPGRAQVPSNGESQGQRQTQAATEQNGDMKHGEMAGLNLTDEQKTQIKQIHADSRSQVAAVNADTALAADAKQAKIRQIRISTRQQVMKVLTPAQRKQMKQNMHERRAERQQAQPQAQPPVTPQQ